jgi:hypothetical protein
MTKAELIEELAASIALIEVTVLLHLIAMRQAGGKEISELTGAAVP